MDYIELIKLGQPMMYGFVAGFWIGGISYIKNSVLSADDTDKTIWDKITSQNFDKKRFIITAISTGAMGGFIYLLIVNGAPPELIYAAIPLALRESISNIVQIATGLNKKGGSSNVAQPPAGSGQPPMGATKSNSQPA